MSRAPIRRSLPAAVLVLSLLGAAGTAVALWTASGTGTGSAEGGTAQDVTITPGTPAARLAPGGRTDVVLTMTNPNAFDVRVQALWLDANQGTGGFAVDGSHSGCNPSTLGYTPQTTGWTVPAGDDLDVTLSDALSMGESAANACQGATFTVYLQAGAG